MAKVEDKPVMAQGYTKAQITESKRFTEYRDILNGILEDGKTYTLDEVETIINTFLRKEVE